jgi:hypothetical protein
LPAGRAGQREPLIVTGRSGAGDLLMIEYVDAQTVRFALDHWGMPLSQSEPLRIDFDQPHTFDIAMPALEPVANASTSRSIRTGKLRVRVDGRQVWEHTSPFYATEAEEIAIGRNPIGGTSGGLVFGGDILFAGRVARE